MKGAAQELRSHAAAPLGLGRACLVAVGLCVAAFVAGDVAGDVHSHLGTPPAGPRVSVAIGDIAVATIVSVMAVGLTLFLILRPRRRRREAAPDPPPLTRLQKLLVSTAFCLAVAAPLAVILLLHRRSGATGSLPPPAARVPKAPAAGTRAPVPVHVHWTLFVALAAAAIAILVFVALSRARSLPVLPAPVAREPLVPAITAGIEALAGEGDPRGAVIGAYAAMERTLGEEGLPRRPSEAPVEYLVRVLTKLGASADAARRLTLLFEQARYSLHEIDERMRGDALAALADLRAELEHAT